MSRRARAGVMHPRAGVMLVRVIKIIYLSQSQMVQLAHVPGQLPLSEDPETEEEQHVIVSLYIQ